MSIRPQHIIGPSPAKWNVRYQYGDTKDIVRTILHADRQMSQFVLPSVEMLRGATQKDTLRNVFEFVRDNITYVPDRPGFEVVRSPGYLMQSRVGDCKSFAILTAALVKALGFKYAYRFTGSTPTGPINHVYLVAFTSDGQEVVMDSTPPARFNRNPRHGRRKDILPGTKNLSGINGSTLESTAVLIGLLGLLFLLAKKVKA